jgi:hypothetical protein
LPDLGKVHHLKLSKVRSDLLNGLG